MEARNQQNLAAGIFTVAAVSTLALALALAEPPPEKAPARQALPPAVAEPIAPPWERQPEPQEAARYSVREEAQARLTTNEAGLPSASHPTIDGPLIGWIVAHNADVFGIGVEAWIARAHTRHTRAGRTDGNRWVAHLSASLERPEGWPEARIPWTSARGVVAWQARLDEARAWQDGRIPLVCPAAYPRTWGGPFVDRCNILRKLIAGTHRVVAGPPIADCVVTDPLTGEVVQVLTEPAGARRDAEQCFVTDDGGDALTDARNVYLARTSELDR